MKFLHETETSESRVVLLGKKLPKVSHRFNLYCPEVCLDAFGMNVAFAGLKELSIKRIKFIPRCCIGTLYFFYKVISNTTRQRF